tara:strand:- start:4263 stop:4637 length:375 start_codon:yes stop_codon:yes gene_type:complete
MIEGFPELINETINYYVWRTDINRVNDEYRNSFSSGFDNVLTRYRTGENSRDVPTKLRLSYNYRNLELYSKLTDFLGYNKCAFNVMPNYLWPDLHRYVNNDESCELPERYIFSLSVFTFKKLKN